MSTRPPGQKTNCTDVSNKIQRSRSTRCPWKWRLQKGRHFVLAPVLHYQISLVDNWSIYEQIARTFSHLCVWSDENIVVCCNFLNYFIYGKHMYTPAAHYKTIRYKRCWIWYSSDLIEPSQYMKSQKTPHISPLCGPLLIYSYIIDTCYIVVEFNAILNPLWKSRAHTLLLTK